MCGVGGVGGVYLSCVVVDVEWGGEGGVEDKVCVKEQRDVNSVFDITGKLFRYCYESKDGDSVFEDSPPERSESFEIETTLH